MTRLKTAARGAIFSSVVTLPANIFSTSAKFSRHLIFHLPGAVFKDNIHAGETDMLRYDFIFTVKKVGGTKHGLRSFRYFAGKIWNALPDLICTMAGTREFLRSIRHVAF